MQEEFKVMSEEESFESLSEEEIKQEKYGTESDNDEVIEDEEED